MDEQNNNNNVDSEEEKERKRAEIKAKIRMYEEKIRTLEGYIEVLQGRSDATYEGSLIPEIEYDLSVSGDIVHWQGERQSEGVEHQGNTASGISTFLSGISTVIDLINKLIIKYLEIIEELKAELESI